MVIEQFFKHRHIMYFSAYWKYQIYKSLVHISDYSHIQQDAYSWSVNWQLYLIFIALHNANIITIMPNVIVVGEKL